ncbi:MAG: TIGR00730 family Rossman fold protein [Segniliparus sp.]|uniref:LOG family protein n=1 Tax=Segniliparus sp. TaxID=2804064 RepID=UPI003F409E25
MRVAVYCGASAGADPAYARAAADFAVDLVRAGAEIVYGGGHKGLMGVVADAALAAGGRVHGVIPSSLVDKELAHPGLTSQRVVDTMYRRKQLMLELADAAVALPGGLGTLDELFDVWGSAQLALHPKPVGVLNVNGFWTSLLTAVRGVLESGFIAERSYDLLIVAESAQEYLEKAKAFAHPGGRW